MKTLPLNRFSTLPFKNGSHLNNRIVVPPMASETADKMGFVTDKTIDHYSRLSQSQAGLVMVEYTYVHYSGRSEENQLGLDSDAHEAGIKIIADKIHTLKAFAGIQLTHAGGKSETCFTGGVLMGPSPIIVPVKDQLLETPTEMTLTYYK
jgi:NADPH2 dehydrogenase